MVFRFPPLAAIRRSAAAAARRGRLLCYPPISTPFVSEEKPAYAYTPSRFHVGHHHGPPTGSDGPGAERVFRLGLACDVALTVGKAVAGYLSGSTAVTADAAHSLSDIVLSGVALLSYKAARAPSDSDHPYGHGKFESLGALGISTMLLFTAGGIAWHALDVLQGVLSSSPDILNNGLQPDHHHHGHGGHHHGMDLEHPILALGVTVVAISVKEGLYWITKLAGERDGSGLLKANAWHHRVDAISSVVALIGVGGAFLGLPLLDPIAGLAVSGMILKAGAQSGYQSILELVDAAVDSSMLQPIKETILDVKGVKGCHRLRGRKAGTFLYLDVHIEVDPFLSVSAAHDIGETVRHQIQSNHSHVTEVFIHIDPSYFESKLHSTCSDKMDSELVPKQLYAEAVVADILSSHFAKKMTLEHLMLHTLQGEVLLEIQVSMPSDMQIRDAMEIAKEAEQEILRADSSINQIFVQLRLGKNIRQFQPPSSCRQAEHGKYELKE